MVAAEEQQQCPQTDSPTGENAAHMANQVSSKLAQKPLSNGVEKTSSESDTGENTENVALETTTKLSKDAKDVSEKELHGEGFVDANEADAAGESEKVTTGKTGNPLVEDVFMPMDVDNTEQEVKASAVEQIEETTDVEKLLQLVEGGSQAKVAVRSDSNAAVAEEVAQDEETMLDGGKDEETKVVTLPVDEVRSAIVAGVVGKDEKTMEESIAMEVESEDKEAKVDTTAWGKGGMAASLENSEEVTQTKETTQVDVCVASEDVEMAVDATSIKTAMDSTLLDEVKAAAEDIFGESQQESSISNYVVVTKEVSEVVTTLVDNVVDFVDETVSVDGETLKILSSPMIPHLSADEAMEFLEVHQGDDRELLPQHDDGADADVETDLTDNHQYQWFDGDEDDEEGVAIEAPSVLDVAEETTDDVFGFGSVDLSGVTPSLGDSADVNSDESGDTLVIPSSSSSSSSSASSSSGSLSSSSSSSSASSASEDERVGLSSKKRHASASTGPRKLLKYKKQKRAHSSEPEKPPQKRYKRKRKIPQPVIPKEFAVFELEAADPILKGSYGVRNNRRACFTGSWGFSDDAFQNIDSVSPFEYTSRARVLQSRRKEDKRPVSGKYGGFFKLRQFNGKLVKIREDQVDLQFLPMPSSDGEDDEDMEGYDSDDDDDSEMLVASRYIVLGKGKNRFGRFLIRGYLNPESGRLTVKRRYLE